MNGKKYRKSNKLKITCVFHAHKETLDMFCQGGHLSVFALLQRLDRFPEKVPEFGRGGDNLE